MAELIAKQRVNYDSRLDGQMSFQGGDLDEVGLRELMEDLTRRKA